MKKGMIIAAMLLMLGQGLRAQEFDYESALLPITEITAKWQKAYIFSATQEKNIKSFMLGFHEAYPNTLTRGLVAKLIGLKPDESYRDMICDMENGYATCTFEPQGTERFQMCYWKCANGDLLIGVCFEAYREGESELEDEVEAENEMCLNDLTFFKILKGEVRWTPVPPKQLLGRDYNYRLYDIQLPRTGKNIVLTYKFGDKKRVTLTWNGTSFTAK